ncbi:MAG: methyltransferase domain-containing protein [Planctomycetota bacterium]
MEASGSSSVDSGTPPLDHKGLLGEVERFRLALVDQTAKRCSQAGWTTIALFGAGQHTRRYIRQPWRWRGVRVAAVLDDAPRVDSIDGVPVVLPADMPGGIDAVVISSDAHEPRLYHRAMDALDGRAPVLRIYGDPPPKTESDVTPSIARLCEAGVAAADAQWLAENRAERHDAAFDSLPLERTELHLRRYLLAARYARGRRVLDAACGTGYGSALLIDRGAQSVTGVDVDRRAVEYAKRYHARDGIEYSVCDVTQVPLADGAIDLITSFETVEHLPRPDRLFAEFARVLTPGGMLVLSTPNDLGTTEHHEHSLTRADLEELLAPGFRAVEALGQIAGNDPVEADFPPAIFRQSSFDLRPDTLIVVAERR